MSKPNSVTAYIKPKYDRLINGLSKLDGSSKSEVAAKAIEQYFDAMHPKDREKILNIDKAVR